MPPSKFLKPWVCLAAFDAFPVFHLYLSLHGGAAAALVSPVNHLAASDEMLPALQNKAALCCLHLPKTWQQILILNKPSCLFHDLGNKFCSVECETLDTLDCVASLRKIKQNNPLSETRN